LWLAVAAGAAVLALALLSSAADIPCIWTGVERIVAIADLHGDYDHFVAILRSESVGLVDADLHWTGGETHLVQMGDILDRGTRARDILDLLMRLEGEAAAAGGMVHVLLGNHEEITMARISLGYPDFVTVEQFVSFLPDDFRKAREKDYIAGLPPEVRARVKAEGLDLVYDQDLRLFWTTLMRRDDLARSAYFEGFDERYGKWLLRKNAVIKINGVVFTHGGINLEYSAWKIKEINNLYRLELGLVERRPGDPQLFGRPYRPKILYKSGSPLWYRIDEANSKDVIDRILANLGAKVMVVGHNFLRAGGGSPTLDPDKARERARLFGGKVWMIDTGISGIYGGFLSALIIRDGDISLWEEAEPPETRRPRAGEQGGAPVTPEEVEAFLRVASVTSPPEPAAAGRTEPWSVRLEFEGIRMRGQFKYIDRRRPTPLPDSYKYELAAYELAKHLDLSFVPPIVEREIHGTPGALQRFVENALPEADRKRRNLQPADPAAFAGAMDDLRVLLNLVNEPCGNERDILIQQDTGQVYRVDFSEAFAPDTVTPQGCEILRCSRKLYKALVDWDEGKVKTLLAPFLNEEEARALNARRGLIVWMIGKQIERRGESAVLF
jgi:hypothetical protein